MNGAWHLAWRSLRWYRARTLILIGVVGVVGAVPLGVHLLADRADASLRRRAAATPLVLGAPGNRFDLVFAALYHRPGPVEPLPAGVAAEVRATGLADAFPVHVRFTARGRPVVGAELDLLQWRGLRPAAGGWPRLLGDAILGATAARDLGLAPGGVLATDAAAPFDLADTHPLRLRVTGVLASTGGPDDDAVFVDLRTAWIVAGHGHGHAAVTGRATPGLPTAQAVDPTALDAFHLHGDPADLPVTAIIVAPRDAKARALLRARLQDRADLRVRVPAEVVDEVLGWMLRLRALLDAHAALVALAMLALLGLVVALAERLRAAERATLVALGCGPGRVAGIVALEWSLVLVAGAGVAAALAWGAGPPLARVLGVPL
ncbi:MAG: hypothetical protein H6704_28435 [Myxococcales bacterium]|nr:hypothetical protein [Myxococcales bacterium]